MSVLKGKRILVGITGSIAAFKACELVRVLRKEGADVTVAMTRSATQFVGPTTFAAFTSHPVLIEQFPQDPAVGVPHVDAAEFFDAVVVAPATANILGKTAHAIADDLLSTLLNIVACPVLFAPAMNFRMWSNPATQDAVARLRGWGRRVMDPAEGQLATLHEGVGRLPEIPAIMDELRDILGASDLYRGKKVLITAGPTREPIDPVRYISNRSSGRMGYALAAAARDMGADVTLVSGPVELPPVPGCRMVAITTAEELLSTMKEQIQGHDVLFMAAAVADFQPVTLSPAKIRRAEVPDTLSLKPAPDILKAIKKNFKGKIVAFALEPAGNLDGARQKLADKGADILVMNAYDEPGAGMETDSNHVWILTAAGEITELPMARKETIARQILELAVSGLG